MKTAIEVYLWGTAVVAGVSLLIALAHVADFASAPTRRIRRKSAEGARGWSIAVLASPLWPLALIAAVVIVPVNLIADIHRELGGDRA